MNNKYDPSRLYTWTPEDVFTMSGEEFGLVLNAIRGILSTPEAARILLLDKANTAIEGMMIKAVENGTVKEADKPPVDASKLHVVN